MSDRSRARAQQHAPAEVAGPAAHPDAHGSNAAAAAALPAPEADMTFTLDEVARYEAAASAERQHGVMVDADARENAGNSRVSEGVNLAGAVNDTVGGTSNAIDGVRGMARTVDGRLTNLRLPPTAGPERAPAISGRITGGLGAASGLAQGINAFRQGMEPGATQHTREQAAYGVGIGALGAAGGVMSMAGRSAAPFGALAGGLEVAQGVGNLRSNDVNDQGAGGQQVMHGALSGIAAVAGSSPLGAVAGAGAAGVSIGTTLQQRAEAVSLESGRYQEAERDRSGRVTGSHAISASEEAARRGQEDGQLTTEGLRELGVPEGAANAMGFAGGLVNTGIHAVGTTLSNLW